MTMFIDELGGMQDIPQSAMLQCPFAIAMPEHYRNDHTCKCDDPTERERMKQEWGYTDADFRKAGLI